jgi:hypothetical protein
MEQENLGEDILSESEWLITPKALYVTAFWDTWFICSRIIF